LVDSIESTRMYGLANPKQMHFATYIFEKSHFEVPTLSVTAIGPDLNTYKTKNKSQFKEDDITNLTHVVSKRIES